MKVWEDAVASALLGTEKRPFESSAATGPIAALLSKAAEGGRERALLAAAGALTVYRRAGLRPTMAEGRPIVPVPDEVLPTCSPAAAVALAKAIDGDYSMVLDEALRALADRGRLVPAELLPPLLNTGGRDQSVRGLLPAVVGERGRWLARLNPAWDYLASSGAEDPQTRWASGTRAERLEALGVLRRLDPAAGLALLGSTWTQESGEDRADFLKALAEGLGDGDEPFLEGALDDRRKDVRITAADLLARLPGSGLMQRMAERTRPLIRVESRLLRRRLVIDLPIECDPGMVRDGVVPKPPRGMGERSWWMEQSLGATSLETWTKALSLRPDQVVALAVDSDAMEALERGWSRAARRQDNAEWAKALAWTFGDRDAIAAMPPGHREEFAMAALRRSGFDASTAELLQVVPGPWSEALGLLVLSSLARVLVDPWQGLPSVFRRSMVAIATRLDHRLAEGARRELAPLMTAGGWIGDDVFAMLDLLSFRHELLEELS
jgi:hypothetical protein